MDANFAGRDFGGKNNNNNQTIIIQIEERKRSQERLNAFRRAWPADRRRCRWRHTELHPIPTSLSFHSFESSPGWGVWNQYTGIVKGGTRTKSGPVSTPPCSIYHSSKSASVSHMHLQCAQSQKTLLILHSIPRLSSILTPQGPAGLASGEYIECPARPTGWLSGYVENHA